MFLFRDPVLPINSNMQMDTVPLCTDQDIRCTTCIFVASNVACQSLYMSIFNSSAVGC